MSTSEGKETWPLSDRTAWPAAPGVTGPTTRTRPCGPLRTLCLVNGRSWAMRHWGTEALWFLGRLVNGDCSRCLMDKLLICYYVPLHLLHYHYYVRVILKTAKIGLIGNLGHIKPKLWLHHAPPTVQQVVGDNSLTPSTWQISFDANGRNLH